MKQEVDLKKEFSLWQQKTSKTNYEADILYERYSKTSLALARYFYNLGLNAKPNKGIWHDSSEEPDDRSHCIVSYGGDKYVDFELVFYTANNKCFITESYPHPTERIIEGETIATHKCERDRIPLTDVVKWCYLSDLIKEK